jgi:indole-3-glycerol phosphate synthase
MSILDEIFAHKAVEVEGLKQQRSLAETRRLAEISTPPLDFIAALLRRPGQRPALIAEIKRASPSRGLLAPNFDPQALARLYTENGASAISVLTEAKYFQGSIDILRQVASLDPRLPLLRKDFMLDPYQVYEARAAGADAILLIAAYLDPDLLSLLHDLALSLGMAALVEVHSQAEIEKAFQSCQPPLLGINNRDLGDFSVDLSTAGRLRKLAPPETCVVAESGIHTPADVDKLMAAGIDAILVGEALVTATDPGAKVRSLAR